MTRAIGTMSDKLLGMVLKEKRAGACVREHGGFCYCKGGTKYTYNCNGICAPYAPC